MIVRSLLAAAFVVASSVIWAADMKSSASDEYFSRIIFVSGAIEPEDVERFRMVSTGVDDTLVLLDSEGGSTFASIEIGRIIRMRGFTTAVAAHHLCASGCALIWLSGRERFFSTDSSLGFHASYEVADGHANVSGVGNALVGAYLNQLGLSDAAIVFVTNAPPEGMAWLSFETARQLGIAFEDLVSLPNLAGTGEGVPAAHDPIAAATAFYRALAAADGEAAAAIIIPEKRGLGPFNEAAIRNFYGNLAKPLRIIAVSPLSDAIVRVSYQYTLKGGRLCDGRTDVETTYRYGKTMITRIKALDGC